VSFCTKEDDGCSLRSVGDEHSELERFSQKDTALRASYPAWASNLADVVRKKAKCRVCDLPSGDNVGLDFLLHAGAIFSHFFQLSGTKLP
jgi:hypothetical protein